MNILPIQIPTPFSVPLFHLGPSLDEGALPTFIYFSLSGEESLALSPYNHPVLPFLDEKIRVFSFTIPAHGPGFDKFKAMELWSSWAFSGIDFLSPFLDEIVLILHWLIEENIINPLKLAAGGLSRGAFVATHLTAREKQIKTLLAFAPMTTLTGIEEFIKKKDEFFLKNMEKFDLKHLCESLLHLTHCRFYIGNRDTRVSTDACFAFIRALADSAYNARSKTSIEMRIHPSLGFKGHGTSAKIFEEGAYWLKDILRNLE